MKLKDLLPMLKISTLHESVYEACITINYDKTEKYIYDFKVGDLVKLGEREVIGISTYLPFTIWLKNKEE